MDGWTIRKIWPEFSGKGLLSEKMPYPICAAIIKPAMINPGFSPFFVANIAGVEAIKTVMMLMPKIPMICDDCMARGTGIPA